MTRAYSQAYLLKRRQMNEQLWLNGVYVANAFGVVIGNAFGKNKKRYLDKPLDIFEKTEAEKEQERRKQRLRMIEWLERFRRSAMKKSKGVDQDGHSGDA